jgi:hypothetical protein
MQNGRVGMGVITTGVLVIVGLVDVGLESVRVGIAVDMKVTDGVG